MQRQRQRQAGRRVRTAELSCGRQKQGVANAGQAAMAFVDGAAGPARGALTLPGRATHVCRRFGPARTTVGVSS